MPKKKSRIDTDPRDLRGIRIINVLLAAAIIVVIGLIFLKSQRLAENPVQPAVSSDNVAEDILNAPCSLHFIDVGEGDSALVISDGSAILIDGGENGQGEVVLDYLKAHNVEKLDLIIATHPHSDHIGGLDTVINGIEVGKVIMPQLPQKIVPTTKTFTDFLKAIEDSGAEAEYTEAGDEFQFGNGVFKVFSPRGDYEISDLNNSSVGVKFTYDGVSALFTGDMEQDAEKNVIDGDDISLHADILKVGHHGSRTSTGRKFYDEINPKYCVISLAADNKYGFPHKETLKTLATNNAAVYRTDKYGSIAFYILNSQITAVTSKSGDAE